jgi:pimeloyl-ACP methyl ester carboxylesterase
VTAEIGKNMSIDTRQLVGVACQFESHGTVCSGWFYPPASESYRGCVVMAHGFGAAPSGPLADVARSLATAGIAAFAFDFRNFGASGGQPRQLLNIDRQLEDWGAALRYVRSRGDVDPDRIGLWGSSLTGGQVITVAARDHQIAAVVAQVPYTDGWSIARAAGLRHNLKALPAISYDLLRAAVGLSPHLIDGLGPPGTSAAVSTRYSDLYEVVRTRAPAWRNLIAARSLLDLYRFRPRKVADQIRCPMLVVLTYRDLVAPSEVAIRIAQELPYVELALFPARHFDLYGGEVLARALRTEILFFGQHFGMRSDQPNG